MVGCLMNIELGKIRKEPFVVDFIGTMPGGRKTMMNLSLSSQSVVWDLSLGPPKYEVAILFGYYDGFPPALK